MNSIACLVFGLIVSTTLSAQKQVASSWTINATSAVYDSLFFADDWRLEGKEKLVPLLGADWMQRMLKVGDIMPDILIGNELNSPHEDIRFSRYSGKLVILDFWNTWCQSCIASFPKMEALQKRFGDSIQILLVNIWETREEIQKKACKLFKLPKLPVIVNARNLFPLFPHQINPYHIWIGANRRIKLMGYDFNTYESKIQAALNEEEISYIPNESTVPAFNPKIPYYTLLKKTVDKSKYNSYFTSFNPSYATSGGYSLNVIDSGQYTRRNTFVNISLIDIFRVVWGKQLYSPEVKIIYSPYNAQFEIKVPDTLKYTEDFFSLFDRTDKTYSNTRYCYEQMAPLHYPQDQLLDLMKEDLIDFTAKSLGGKVYLQQDDCIVYSLVRINNRKPSQSFATIIAGSKSDTILIKGQKMVRYVDYPVQDAIGANINSTTPGKRFNDKKSEYIISELKDDKVKYLILPVNGNFEILRNALNMQGYDFVKKLKKMTRLVISGH